MLADTPEVSAVLGADGLEAALDPRGYLGVTDQLIARALAEHARGAGMSVEVAHELLGPMDGPPVILSCSLGTDRSMWDPQTPALAGTHLVVRYDSGGTASPRRLRVPMRSPTWAKTCWR